MKRILLLLSLTLTSFQLFGQKPLCNTQQLLQFLVEQGAASKADKEFVWCKPIIMNPKQDGVFAFGINETDTYTFFLTKTGDQLSFSKDLKIDTILHDLSGYLKSSSFSYEDKIKCYTEVLKIVEEERKAYAPWSLTK